MYNASRNLSGDLRPHKEKPTAKIINSRASKIFGNATSDYQDPKNSGFVLASCKNDIKNGGFPKAAIFTGKMMIIESSLSWIFPWSDGLPLGLGLGRRGFLRQGLPPHHWHLGRLSVVLLTSVRPSLDWFQGRHFCRKPMFFRAQPGFPVSFPSKSGRSGTHQPTDVRMGKMWP